MEVDLMNEKRKYPRITLNQMIEHSMGKETMVQAQGVNISEGGILFQTASELELYSRLFVSFSIMENDTSTDLSCEGIVVRSDKSGDLYDTGMEFADLNEKNNIILKSCIRDSRQ